MDTAEDYKVCVTESLLILKRNGFSTASIEFTVGDALGCAVSGVGEVGEMGDSLEDGISRALLLALLGTVDFVKESDRVVKIVFEG